MGGMISETAGEIHMCTSAAVRHLIGWEPKKL